MGEVVLLHQEGPLRFFRQHHEELPLLTEAARVFLTRPVAQVASERLFSVSGGTTSGKRSRSGDDTVEAMTIGKYNGKKLGFFTDVAATVVSSLPSAKKSKK